MLPVAAPAVVGENFAVKIVLWPAASVAGVDRPVMLNPVPDALPCETEMLAVPELVNVTFTEPLEPTSKLPKLMLDGFAARLPCTPVPVSGIETVESLALLVIVMLPEAIPAVVGANCAVKLALWLAASVSGPEIPSAVKPLPAALIAEIVALALPLLVSVIVCWPLLPTETFPNDTLPGLAVNVELVETPLPIKVTIWGEVGALSVKEMLPVAAPAAVGANCTLKDSDWPPVSVFGKESPLMPKPFPVTVAILMTTFVVPVFVNCTFCVPVCPTMTFPKVSAEGEMLRPVCVPVPLSETIMGELEASLITVRLPVAAPAAVGANWIWIVLLWPTAIVPEGFPPITLNPAPVIVACEMVTVAVPVLVTVKLCVVVFPTATLPKLRLAPLAESTPAPEVPGDVFAALV
jgi:hypothetical protein